MAVESPPTASGLPVLGKTLDYMRGHLDFLDDVYAECGDIALVKVAAVGTYCIVSRPAYFRQVLVDDGDAFVKTDDFDVLSGTGVLAAEGEPWQRQRRILTEFFYPERIRSYADDIVALTERRVDRWEPGATVSIRDRMTPLTLDVLFKVLFDYELAVGGDEALRGAVSDLTIPFNDHVWALPDWVPLLSRRRYRRACDVLEREARRVLAEREGRGSGDGDDLLSTLAAVRAQQDAALSDREIVDNLRTLFFAGHDTTANLVTCALHQLGQYPGVRERFHAELDDVLGDERPTLATLADLEVTERVVNETLRRYPSVNLSPRRAARDVEIGGYHVPEGMRVHLSIWNLHRHEEFWDDPDAWRPSRWVDTSPEEQGYAFLPFLAGPHSCLGEELARLEATAVLATIGQRYWFDPVTELTLENAGTARPVDAAPARLVARS